MKGGTEEKIRKKENKKEKKKERMKKLRKRNKMKERMTNHFFNHPDDFLTRVQKVVRLGVPFTRNCAIWTKIIIKILYN